jgi:hypothetical protein
VLQSYMMMPFECVDDDVGDVAVVKATRSIGG